MMTFTFKGIGGDLRTVEANTEREARHKAMVEKWGPPYGIYGNRYDGRGLVLIETESSDTKDAQ